MPAPSSGRRRWTRRAAKPRRRARSGGTCAYPHKRRRAGKLVPTNLRGLRVWIDLTNSPHVLVMRPVIDVLRARGDEVLVTARDFAQTLGLLERFRIDHTAIGHHRGGKLAAKGLGLASRSGALVRWARGRKF